MGPVEESSLHFHSRFQNLHGVRQVSRRGFLGRLLGSAAALTAWPSAAHAFTSSSTIPTTLESRHAPDDERYWELVASEFLLHKNIAYMNTGTRGPSPRSVHLAQIEALNNVNADYFGFSKTGCNKEFLDVLRSKLATFVGAKPTELAFTSNTTEGMIFGTLGVDLKPGDEIVFTNHDHPGGGNPILHRAAREGLAVRVLDLSDRKFHPPKNADELLTAFDAALTHKTKLMSFCHINYTDGCIMPVKDICALARAKGVVTLVDGAQPPGMMKVDVHDLGCDMYAGPCHKWILASMFTGFFYVREEMQERVWPTMFAGAVNGKTMYGQPPSKTMADACVGAAKYEYHGSIDFPAKFAVNAALDFHNVITTEAIEARDRYLAQRLRKGLRAIDGVEVYSSDEPSLSCALVAFTIKGMPTLRLVDLLWERHGIYIRNVTHEEIGWDVNRASLHVMVTAQQVDTLLGAIEEIAKGKG